MEIDSLLDFKAELRLSISSTCGVWIKSGRSPGQLQFVSGPGLHHGRGMQLREAREGLLLMFDDMKKANGSNIMRWDAHPWAGILILSFTIMLIALLSSQSKSKGVVISGIFLLFNAEIYEG